VFSRSRGLQAACPASALIEVGTDHRLADPEPLAAMLTAAKYAYFLRASVSSTKGRLAKGQDCGGVGNRRANTMTRRRNYLQKLPVGSLDKLVLLKVQK
jgi:hypothetical protein